MSGVAVNLIHRKEIGNMIYLRMDYNAIPPPLPSPSLHNITEAAVPLLSIDVLKHGIV